MFVLLHNNYIWIYIFFIVLLFFSKQPLWLERFRIDEVTLEVLTAHLVYSHRIHKSFHNPNLLQLCVMKLRFAYWWYIVDDTEILLFLDFPVVISQTNL